MPAQGRGRCAARCRRWVLARGVRMGCGGVPHSLPSHPSLLFAPYPAHYPWPGPRGTFRYCDRVSCVGQRHGYRGLCPESVPYVQSQPVPHAVPACQLRRLHPRCISQGAPLSRRVREAAQRGGCGCPGRRRRLAALVAWASSPPLLARWGASAACPGLAASAVAPAAHLRWRCCGQVHSGGLLQRQCPSIGAAGVSPAPRRGQTQERPACHRQCNTARR